jgi:hypothetical protein
MEQSLWRCECGAVEADLPVNGARLICYCQSCRAFVERLNKADRLDAAGGSDLLQVAPDRVSFRKGTDHLAWFQITQKGPLRWYTTCCGTPMANTLATRQVPFASFQAHDISPAEHLPHVSGRVHLKGATDWVKEPKGRLLPLIMGFVGRAIKARLTGTWRKNPFFDEHGRPIAAQQKPENVTG